jgi:hypothetical protein
MMPLSAVSLLWKLYPAIREVFRATRRKSDGGKRITKAERDEIIAKILPKIAKVLEKELG